MWLFSRLTWDLSGRDGQAERDVVLVVTHLPQELELELAQHLRKHGNKTGQDLGIDI